MNWTKQQSRWYETFSWFSRIYGDGEMVPVRWCFASHCSQLYKMFCGCFGYVHTYTCVLTVTMTINRLVVVVLVFVCFAHMLRLFLFSWRNIKCCYTRCNFHEIFTNRILHFNIFAFEAACSCVCDLNHIIHFITPQRMLYLMLGKFHLHTIWSKFTSGRMCASSTTIYFAVNCDFIFKF